MDLIEYAPRSERPPSPEKGLDGKLKPSMSERIDNDESEERLDITNRAVENSYQPYK